MKPVKMGLTGLLMVCCVVFALEARGQSPAGLSVNAVERVEQGRSGRSTESLRVALRMAALDQPKPAPDHSADGQQVKRINTSPARVEAASSLSPRLSLRANNIVYGTMEHVGFTWRIEPFVAGVLYYINFGDGYGGWVSETEAGHGYRQSGVYRVLLRARVGGRDIQSNEIMVTVQEVVRPLFYRWLAAILGMAGVLLVLSYVFASTRRREVGTRMREDARAAPVLVRAHKDPGICRLEFSTRVAVAQDVGFQPAVDIGVHLIGQRIPPLERKDEKRA